MAHLRLRTYILPVALGVLLVGTSVQTSRGQTAKLVPLSPEMIARVIDPTTRVALVGDQTILAGDLLPTIDQMLDQYEGKVDKLELDEQRAIAVQQMLPRKIEMKLVLVDFFRTIGDKKKEVLGNIDKQVEKQFYKEQVPLLLKQLELESLRELEDKLTSFGSSIGKQKADFREQMIVQTIIGQTINQKPEITHDALLKSYREHSSDYDIPARAIWEKFTAAFDKHPSKAAAERAIVEMGNQVLHGAKFAQVAKVYSNGINADQGGRHDWTTEGSLLSDVLDKAIFSIPLNQLSLILEDDRGFHIIRVIERQDASRVEFLDAQGEIRQTLQNEDKKKQIREYIEKLRNMTYVWTIFDELREPGE